MGEFQSSLGVCSLRLLPYEHIVSLLPPRQIGRDRRALHSQLPGRRLHTAGRVHGIAEQTVSWILRPHDARHDGTRMEAASYLDVSQFGTGCVDRCGLSGVDGIDREAGDPDGVIGGLGLDEVRCSDPRITDRLELEHPVHIRDPIERGIQSIQQIRNLRGAQLRRYRRESDNVREVNRDAIVMLRPDLLPSQQIFRNVRGKHVLYEIGLTVGELVPFLHDRE
mmetsp:Transcript_15233/g.44198  ORF Transcript_15233/g.44198 Transcript_15233/m.44198 type:complete len:223 (-) Transcript_15233:834-1502(-)